MANQIFVAWEEGCGVDVDGRRSVESVEDAVNLDVDGIAYVAEVVRTPVEYGCISHAP
jgi:hypothetical protein